MSKQKFIEAMGYVDDRILERYTKEEDCLSAGKVPAKKRWIRWVAIAACLALIVAGIYSGRKPDIPIFDDPVYSAQEIAGLFGGTNDGGATNAYTKVYVPNGEYLNLNEIPEQEYLSIYHYDQPATALDEAAFQHFLDGILQKLAAALGSDVPEYTIEEYDRDPSLEIYTKNEGTTLFASQNRSYYRFYFCSDSDDEQYQGIYLNGERVEIDQRQSDEEIITSVSGLQETLFEIFGVSFSDVKVLRSYGSYSSNGVSSVGIFFYNAGGHPLNQFRKWPVSDYIYIGFDNAYNYDEDIVSDSVLYNASIEYYKYRNDPGQEYRETKKSQDDLPFRCRSAFV